MAGTSSKPTAGLRERKKTLTRDTIEDTALRLFLERGYDRVRVEDVCADTLVSQRTFFRYFASKEDLVLGRLRAHLTQAERLFDARPAAEPIQESLRAVIDRVTQDYVAEPDRERSRLRLVGSTPALETGLLTVFAGFERLVRDFAAVRLGTAPEARRARLLGAAVVGAFRVGLESWVGDEAGADLPDLVAENVAAITRGLYDDRTK